MHSHHRQHSHQFVRVFELIAYAWRTFVEPHEAALGNFVVARIFPTGISKP